jgi:transcriptional regulator with XRE-family HTH domain
MQSAERQNTPGPVMGTQDARHDLDKVFARRFRELREIAGVTQLAVAVQMQAAGHPNIHRSTVGKIENADRPVTVGEAVALARIIGVDVAGLLADPDPDSRECQEALAAFAQAERRMAEARVRADHAERIAALERSELGIAAAELGAAKRRLDDMLGKGTLR